MAYCFSRCTKANVEASQDATMSLEILLLLVASSATLGGVQFIQLVSVSLHACAGWVHVIALQALTAQRHSCSKGLCVNAAGTTVKVTTVDGLVDLKISGGTQPGTTLVMSMRGVPRLGGSNSRSDRQVLYICSPLYLAQNNPGCNAVIQRFKCKYGTGMSWGNFVHEVVL